MKLFTKLFGFRTQTNFKELVKDGALIIDVRTPNEYNTGAIPNSLNMPLNSLTSNLNEISNKNQVIITCCASGIRSGSAKGILKAKGYKSVYNGGGWFKLANKIDA